MKWREELSFWMFWAPVLAFICIWFAPVAHAAVWPRPAGGYTPTNHSDNITKYQIDSANHVAISSVKLDGDFNKAFQGLNDLESRTAPSVTGHANTVLYTDGSSSMWGLVSTSLITSGNAASGRLLRADGAGGVSWAQLSSSSIPLSGVISGTYSLPTFTVDPNGFVTSATTNNTPTVTGLNVNGTITATTVTATVINANNVSATNLSGPGLAKASGMLVVSSGGCTVSSGAFNIASCQKVTTGQIGVSFTTAVSGTYVPIPSVADTGGVAMKVTLDYATASPTTAGFRLRTSGSSTGSAADAGIIGVAVF